VKTSLDGPDYVSVRSYHTDDRGGYALLSLPPGDYVVRMAGEASSTRYFSGNRLNPNNDHRGLQPVYYPNGDSPSTALVLHLGPGERANADFRQTTEPAFDINGRLAGFVPQAWTQMRLYREGDRLPLGAAFVKPFYRPVPGGRCPPRNLHAGGSSNTRRIPRNGWRPRCL